jgi:hypothetical protein
MSFIHLRLLNLLRTAEGGEALAVLGPVSKFIAKMRVLCGEFKKFQTWMFKIPDKAMLSSRHY